MSDPRQKRFEGVEKINRAAAGGILVTLPVLLLVAVDAPQALSLGYLVLAVVVLGAVVVRRRLAGRS